MELLESKLHSNNQILVAQIISGLVKNIKKKQSLEVSTPELVFLQDKCLDLDPTVSLVACQALICLLESKILNLNSLLAEFTSRIAVTKCCTPLIYLLGKLLFVELKEKIKEDSLKRLNYNLYFPPHPFIRILQENGNNWTEIFQEVLRFYETDSEVQKYGNHLFRPLILYTLCNGKEYELHYFKRQLWTLLLEHNSTQEKDVVTDILSWFPMQSSHNILLISSLFEQFAKTIIKQQYKFDINIIALWQTTILLQISLFKLDMRQTLHSLREICKNRLLVCNEVILILCKATKSSISVYLSSLMSLFEQICTVNKQEIKLQTLLALKAVVLQILANPCILLNEAETIAKRLYKTITLTINQSPSTCHKDIELFYRNNRTILSSNKEAFISIQLNLLSFDKIEAFLDSLKTVPAFCHLNLIHYLFGLFLYEDKISLKTFRIILTCSKSYPSLTTDLLTLILYKLSNTLSSELHLELLRALPLMVKVKDNLPKVTATIQALRNGPVELQNMSMSLMYEVWLIDNKSYGYLERILCGSNTEGYILRAYILRQICEKRPELHGKEIVAYLSRILNECNEFQGTVCLLALEGITLLCRAGVIDIVTTLKTLSPKFKDDTRDLAIEGLCGLIEEMAHHTYAEASPEFLNEMVKLLWHYATCKESESVMRAAFKALTAFELSTISSNFPEEFLDEELPEKTLPTHAWINLLRKTTEARLRQCGEFLSKLIALEISGFLIYVYKVEGIREPVNLNYLPQPSILKAVVNFIKENLKTWGVSIFDKAYLECLRILSVEYSKPLPPLDWNFLCELIHDPRSKYFVIDIAAKQVMLSGTARRIIENFIVSLSQAYAEFKDVESVFKNLKHLMNSIQPSTLKPFIEKSLKTALESSKEEFKTLLTYLHNVLCDKNIQETNKSTISLVILDLIEPLDCNSEIFGYMLECIKAFPDKYKKQLTGSTSSKSIKISCTLAKTNIPSPLTWLDDSIANVTNDQQTQTITAFIEVFLVQINSQDNPTWILDLIGQIQAKVADRCSSTEVQFYYDTFILGIVIFSGYWVFIEDKKSMNEEVYEMFPQALATLLDVTHWSVCTNQMLEWLYHMNEEELVPVKLRLLFGRGLQALRDDEEFKKNMKWQKYLNAKTL